MTCVTSSIRKKAKSILQAHLEKFPAYTPELHLSPPTSSTSETSKTLSGLRIGIPSELLLPPPNLQIPTPLLDHLRSQGATIHEISVPNLKLTLPAYYVLASAEASSNLARFGGGFFGADAAGGSGAHASQSTETGEERRRRVRTEGFGDEVKKRIMAGTHALSAEWVHISLCRLHKLLLELNIPSEFNNTYLKALHLRRQLRQDLLRAFRIPHPLYPSHETSSDGVDLILHPTAIGTAPILQALSGDATHPCAGGPAAETEKTGKNSEYTQDLMTVPASLAGLPAISIPAGRAEDGWTVGISLMGQWGMEEILFWVGRELETVGDGTGLEAAASATAPAGK